MMKSRGRRRRRRMRGRRRKRRKESRRKRRSKKIRRKRGAIRCVCSLHHINVFCIGNSMLVCIKLTCNYDHHTPLCAF